MENGIHTIKTFALIGAAGFVAPRHMRAIKDTGNRLLAALDRFDSVGIIDSFFPEADFFVEFERFDRHVEKRRRRGTQLDYLSVCSPNYLHDAHIRFGLRVGADVLPESAKAAGARTYRSLRIGEEEFEFSGGFEDLHTRSYEEVLACRGFRLGEARQAIELVHDIRNAKPAGLKGEYHPLAEKPLAGHPLEGRKAGQLYG